MPFAQWRFVVCKQQNCKVPQLFLFYLVVTLKNVSELLEFSLLYNANQLRDICTEYICNNLGSLMEARSVKSQISPNTVRVKNREHRLWFDSDRSIVNWPITAKVQDSLANLKTSNPIIVDVCSLVFSRLTGFCLATQLHYVNISDVHGFLSFTV